jgi:serine/threonine protein kinase
MAPEVMCKNNHGIAADYFAVGVIAWECMFGRRPYQGKSRKEIRDAILAKQAHIRKNEVPEGWDVEAADFINKVSIFYSNTNFSINFLVSAKESFK